MSVVNCLDVVQRVQVFQHSPARCKHAVTSPATLPCSWAESVDAGATIPNREAVTASFSGTALVTSAKLLRKGGSAAELNPTLRCAGVNDCSWSTGAICSTLGTGALVASVVHAAASPLISTGEVPLGRSVHDDALAAALLRAVDSRCTGGWPNGGS